MHWISQWLCPHGPLGYPRLPLSPPQFERNSQTETVGEGSGGPSSRGTVCGWDLRISGSLNLNLFLGWEDSSQFGSFNVIMHCAQTPRWGDNSLHFTTYPPPWDDSTTEPPLEITSSVASLVTEHPGKKKMTMENSNHLKMYLILKMVIFQLAMLVFPQLMQCSLFTLTSLPTQKTQKSTCSEAQYSWRCSTSKWLIHVSSQYLVLGIVRTDWLKVSICAFCWVGKSSTFTMVIFMPRGGL